VCETALEESAVDGEPQDSRQKAMAYADALGVRLGAVRSVSESTATPWGSSRTMLSGGAQGAAAEQIGIEAHVDVVANVTVTYAIDG
jgi:uncharacterized protein YggE